MNSKQPFKWKHFQGEIILLCVRWYLKYPLSYRNLSEVMQERGLPVNERGVFKVSFEGISKTKLAKKYGLKKSF